MRNATDQLGALTARIYLLGDDGMLAVRQLGGFEPDLRYSSDDFLILLELVRTAGAAALLPDLVLASGAAGVATRRPAEGAIRREVFLLTRRSRTPAVAAVADALRAAAEVAIPGTRPGAERPRDR